MLIISTYIKRRKLVRSMIMENWASAVIGAIVAGFTFLTAIATLATKRNDSSSRMTNKSFDIISKRLDIAEAKVSSLESVQSDYRI
ncbi:hypothetical protein [Lactococcus phage P1046]|uniref:Uncharacterized protein n=1 Tax=Lactococcus phage P1046 TaxID=2662294 RepID=A0A649V1S6_9CAUD|nr:hypothetical protein [Lactococcus phage P1046]